MESLLQKKPILMHIILFSSFVLAFILRVIVIGEYGLSEDETLKGIASQNYRNLDFTENSQHPALMKLLVTISVIFLGETEFALRLPNVFIAAFTVYPIFFIGRELYDDLVGYLAGVLWAVNITTISFSTVAKEDTLLTFFWCWTIYFYLKSKDDPKYNRYTGISLGLAIASKYTGLMLAFILFILLFIRSRENPSGEPIKKSVFLFYPTAIITFIIINFQMFLPSSIIHLYGWITDENAHNGYYSAMEGHLMDHRPFYNLILHILIKNTLSYLLILITGIIYILKNRSRADRILLIWIFIPLTFYSLVPKRIPRYYHIIEPAFMLAAIKGVSCFIIYLTSKFKRINVRSNLRSSNLITVIIVILVCINSLFAYEISFPYHRMYVNGLAGGSEKIGYYFPEDSVYDYFLREGIFYVNEHAPQNSLIVINSIKVGEYYGRTDLKFIWMWDLPEDLSLWENETVSFAILQDSRIYYENIEIHENIKKTFDLEKTYKIDEYPVVEIYSI